MCWDDLSYSGKNTLSIKTILNFYVIGPINWAQSFRSNGPALNMRAYTEDYLNKFTKKVKYF